MEYTQRQHADAAIDSIRNSAERMTSGNFMHNKASISLVCQTLKQLLEHATFDDESPWRDAVNDPPKTIDGWSKKVYVLLSGEHPSVAQYQDNKHEKGWSIPYIGMRNNVTHWMPIPEIQKGGENE